MNFTPEAVIRFWSDEVGEKQWYRAPEALNRTIRTRYLCHWQRAHDTGTAPFAGNVRASLAALLLLDQFPRNMFRDDPRAFATDALARATARAAIAAGHDMEVETPLRQFFYLPFEHSENLEDQIEGQAHVEHGLGRGEILRHAMAHAEIIRRFGRFPFRNAALGRRTTAEEQAFLDRGGYAAILKAIAL